MGETAEEITVGAVSADGEGSVDIPVVELLTGRGFVTGKSGSGKSNTASVVAEKLLDRGLSLLIVDIDGEYYGLKEEYEILHVGNDEECDIRVSPEHAGKIADLALDKHVPIILDVSSFLDESEAKELLTEVARHLFTKEKKKKQPFLLVVEEIHEWLPEGGGLDECGRMLIKVAKRGRKHGLGMCGISQRPADVKKDFITQCDWLVWHRLTWGNDTKVVQRILGSDYAGWVEGLNDGEGFLMTDWDEEVRQVQFQRKRTFDAGATPGLEDFERPELKSVSGDLVSDLAEITEEKQARQNQVREMERKLNDKQLRIETLEEKLEEARDLSNMAEQFAQAMMTQATGRESHEDGVGYQANLAKERWTGHSKLPVRPPDDPETEDETVLGDEARPWPTNDGSMTGGESVATGPAATWDAITGTAETTGRVDTSVDEPADLAQKDDQPTPAESSSDEITAQQSDVEADRNSGGPEQASMMPTADIEHTPESDNSKRYVDDEESDGGDGSSNPTETESLKSNSSDESEPQAHTTETAGNSSDSEEIVPYERPVVASLRDQIQSMDPVTRGMLAYYRNEGIGSPLDAHVAAGGDGDRSAAYSCNRTLREAGLIAHAGRGRYGYALPSWLDDAHNGRLTQTALDTAVERVEQTFRERAEVPWPSV